MHTYQKYKVNETHTHQTKKVDPKLNNFLQRSLDKIDVTKNYLFQKICEKQICMKELL